MRALALLGLGVMVLAWPAGAQPAPDAAVALGAPDAPLRLVVRGTTDIDLFEPALIAFLGGRDGVGIDYEEWGSNELSAITRADCRAGAAGADLVVSSAADLQVKLVNDGCATAHRSAATAALPPEARWRDEVFGVTSEAAVIVYNRELVPDGEAPRSRFDLIDLLRPEDSRFAGRVATYDIEASGLGYLFAFADSLQATTFGSLIEAFGRSGAIATCCSAEIIDGVAEGRFLVAYNVLGSYAFARAASDARIAVVLPEDYTLVLARAAMIPAGAAHPAEAAALVDFLLSAAGREVLAASYLIVDPEAAAGGDAARLRPIPLSPVLLLGLDRHKRAAFLDLWRATFPRR